VVFAKPFGISVPAPVPIAPGPAALAPIPVRLVSALGSRLSALGSRALGPARAGTQMGLGVGRRVAAGAPGGAWRTGRQANPILCVGPVHTKANWACSLAAETNTKYLVIALVRAAAAQEGRRPPAESVCRGITIQPSRLELPVAPRSTCPSPAGAPLDGTHWCAVAGCGGASRTVSQGRPRRSPRFFCVSPSSGGLGRVGPGDLCVHSQRCQGPSVPRRGCVRLVRAEADRGGRGLCARAQQVAHFGREQKS
jgi:hypothetical protein